MMFAQYCRIESRAGGVSATSREMIREAHKMLKKSGRGRAQRSARHVWLRDMLSMHHDARLEYVAVMRGGL